MNITKQPVALQTKDVFAYRVAANCHYLRKRKKLNVPVIAQKLGTSGRNYYRIEAAESGALAGRFLSRLCTVFDCNPEDLIRSRHGH